MEKEQHTIEALREMVRIAENSRKEQIEMLEILNKYDLGLIAFSGAFLSLIVTAQLSYRIVVIDGFMLLVSILFALFSLMPRKVQGNVEIREDIRHFEQKRQFEMDEYLFSTAKVTQTTADNIQRLIDGKKVYTIISAISLVLALCGTYLLSI